MMVYLLEGFKPTFHTKSDHVLQDGCFHFLCRQKKKKSAFGNLAATFWLKITSQHLNNDRFIKLYDIKMPEKLGITEREANLSIYPSIYRACYNKNCF